MRRPWPTGGCRAKNKLNNTTKCFYISYMYIHVCMYVCLYIQTIHLRYNLSASLQEYCDLPQIIIVIRPINHEKKLQCYTDTPRLTKWLRSKIRQKSNFEEVKIEYIQGQLCVYVQGNTYVQGSTVKIKTPILKHKWP
jgi:hypothetical protein